jgi:ATP-dependent RNA helicase DeaD
MTPDPTDPTPTLPTFDVLPLSRELRQAIDELGYTHPTPVQREVFEPASRGRDIVVQARTGTGKTAAFGMPVIDTLVQRSRSAVQVVILCPTRELALQVHRELDTLGRYRGVKSVAVYGGAPMARQVEELAAGAQVLVGTPGRVLDHLRRGSLDPSAVRVFILDESDEMLSMGFLPQINEIHGHLPGGHQTLLFSATLPPDIQRHAETRLKDPLFLTLSGDQIGALDIEHLVYLTRGDKLKDFIQVLEVENPESAIVFCNTRDETKRVAAALDRLGFAADWLNADLAQNEREKVMAATRRGDLRFLVCTDVAARGIDISHLTHVINYDLPESAESYVHRTGRTGRAGRTGTAISLIEPTDIGNLYMLRLTYKIFPIERQLPTAGELRTRQELDVVEMFAEAFSNRRAHPDDLSLARRLITHGAAEQIVACLLRDHLGARPEAVREATEARRAKTTVVEPAMGAPRAPEEAESPSTSNKRSPPRRPADTEGRDRQVTAGAGREATRSPSVREPLDGRNVRGAPFVGRNSQAPRDAGPRAEARVEPSDSNLASPAEGLEADVAPKGLDNPRSRRSNGSGAEGSQRVRPARAGGISDPQTRQPRDVGETANARPQRIYRDDTFEFGYSVSDPKQADVDPRSQTTNGSSESSGRVPDGIDSSSSVEIFVNVGRIDGAAPADFLTLLEKAGIAQGASTQVNVRRNHCFVRVSAQDFAGAEAALNGATIAGKLAMAERSRSSRP